ncbi:heparin lyase I family protein [Mycobacterium sp. C31M]
MSDVTKPTLNRRKVLALLGASGALGAAYALPGGGEIAASDAQPPLSHAATINGFGDLTAVFAPDWIQPATAADGFSTVSTPLGDGFEFIVPDSEISPWDSTCKSILAVKYPDTSPVGSAERWTFHILLPKQSLIDEWHTGVLWEFHTNTSSGHHLSLSSDSRFRIGRDIEPVGSRPAFDYTTGPAVPWDRWIKVTMELKWSYSNNGYFKVWIDGVQYVNATAVATVFTGDPYLQFGWYSTRGAGITNRIRFGGIRREIL